MLMAGLLVCLSRYLEQAVAIARTARVGEDVAVGAGTSIGVYLICT